MLNLSGLFNNTGNLKDLLITFGTRLALTVIILFVGFWAVKMVSKTVKKILRNSKTDESLVTFLSSLVSMALKVLVIVTAITQLGVEMTSFVAILASAGLAVGMAFSGTLSNFAGGVMILIFKPFKVGDVILTQGEQGTVKEIQIFNTYLHTSDNKVIILPNGPIANGNITNFTKAEKRRVDLVYGICYGDSIQKAREVLQAMIDEDDRILKDPQPFIGLGALTNNSVDITVRVWTETDEYWNVFFDMNERVYKEFEKNDLHFPAPSPDAVIGNQI